MHRAVSAVAALLLVLSAAGPAAAAGLQQSDGSLSLTVTDGDDALAGADVTLYRDGERVLTGETGADGRLDTGPIDSGSYRVVVREAGYHERSLSVGVDGETSRSVALEPGSVTLSVGVTDARTGDTLADATVDVDAAGTVRTGADGTQTVRVPVNAEVDLTVTKEGYERESLSVAVDESARSIDVEIARDTDLSLALAPDSVDAGGSVEATVTDAYGDPVVGATLLLDGEAVAETGSDGTASVPVETSGEHTVRARAGGTLSDSRTVAASGDSTGDSAGGDSTGGEPSTPAGTATAASTATTPDDSASTATPAPSGTAGATPANASSSPFAGLPLPEIPLSGPVIPELGDREGPLGVLPPIEGSLRIILVLLGIGSIGLVLSILRSDDL